MPRRSVRVTLLNNTPYKLTRVGSGKLCGGEWTSDQWKPPEEIQPNNQGGWQSESGGDIPIIGDIATGTEGWVQYMIGNTDVDFLSGKLCLPEVVYIHWDNPFIPGSDTKPIEAQVSTSPIDHLPCEEEKGGGSSFAVLQGGTSSDQNCRHELVLAGAWGPDEVGLKPEWKNWWVAISFPVVALAVGLTLFGATIDGELDINLGFILELRQVGSVDQTLHSLYDGRKGLRALASEAGKSSLRQLFNM